MEDTDYNEKAFDMIGPNAPQDVKDAWNRCSLYWSDINLDDIIK